MQQSVPWVISAAASFCEISTFFVLPLFPNSLVDRSIDRPVDTILLPLIPSAAFAKVVSLRIFSAQFAAVSDNV